MKKVGCIVASVMFIFFSLFFVSCKKENNKDLTFAEISVFLTEEDKSFREFSGVIVAKNSTHADIELLKSTTEFLEDSISSLALQMDEYQNTINAASITNQDKISITKTNSLIEIKTDSQALEANMNEDRTRLKLSFLSDEDFYILEIVQLDNCYIAQMIYKGDGENYTIYTFKFKGSSGEIAISYATNYSSIFEKEELNYENYNCTGEIVFKS